jgi:integral membrane protein
MFTSVDPRRLIFPLGVISVLETVSFLVLLGGMAVLDHGSLRSFLGLLHGMLFLAYAVLLMLTHRTLGWSARFMVLGILTGPVGAVIVLERMRRESLLTPAAAGGDR